MKTRLTVIFAITSTALLTNFARGQQQDSLPASLPMLGKTEKEFVDWIVTNRTCLVSCRVWYTNTTNVKREIGTFAISTKFNSYGDFRDYTYTNGVDLYNKLLSRTDIVSTITFSEILYYRRPDGAATYASLSSLTNLGYLPDINVDTFSNIAQRVKVAILPVSNLKRFEITVGSDPSSPSYYNYVWSNNAAQSTSTNLSLPAEITDGYNIAFNEWYSTNGCRVRFSVQTTTGFSKTYTQYGDDLQAKMKIDLPVITVSMARGSDLTIEASPDWNHWTSLTNFNWSAGCGQTNVVIKTTLPRQFFRALVN